MKTVFFTIVDDKYYYPVGTHLMVNSFKYFHPDVDLIVFRQNTIDKVFGDKGINFYNAKPTFAKLLTPHYDLVVNIDADTVITARLDPILNTDFEVGSVMNLNDYENASFENITSDMYVQAGLVGATNPKFWDIWEEANKDAMKYKRRENDILNLVWYNDSKVSEMNRVVFDKDYGYMGCKSLNREAEFYLEGKKLMCRGEQVYCYHHAKGGVLPKLVFDQMEFEYEVKEFLKYVSGYGQSEKYGSV
jgi:hypothetical protein